MKDKVLKHTAPMKRPLRAGRDGSAATPAKQRNTNTSANGFSGQITAPVTIGFGSSSVTVGQIDSDRNLVITRHVFCDDDAASTNPEPIEQIVILPDQKAEMFGQLVRTAYGVASEYGDARLLNALRARFTGLVAIRAWLERYGIPFTE